MTGAEDSFCEADGDKVITYHQVCRDKWTQARCPDSFHTNTSKEAIYFQSVKSPKQFQPTSSKTCTAHIMTCWKMVQIVWMEVSLSDHNYKTERNPYQT